MGLDGWERLGDEERTEHGIFHLRSYRARSPRTGDARRFTVIDTADWVNVIGITRDDRIVLVRQYRHGRDEFTLEIPGGIIDPGEAPGDAAVRELREETGWTGGPPVPLGVVDPNPAIMTNRCHTYWIRDCERTDEPSLDPGEDIEVVTMPVADVFEEVAAGRITHALVVCAIWWYRQAADGELDR